MLRKPTAFGEGRCKQNHIMLRKPTDFGEGKGWHWPLTMRTHAFLQNSRAARTSKNFSEKFRNYLPSNHIVSEEKTPCRSIIYLNWHWPLTMRTHAYLVDSNFKGKTNMIEMQTVKKYQNASTWKERNELNATDLRIQQLSYRFASGCGTAPSIEVAALLSNIFWNSFNYWPVRMQSHN